MTREGRPTRDAEFSPGNAEPASIPPEAVSIRTASEESAVTSSELIISGSLDFYNQYKETNISINYIELIKNINFVVFTPNLKVEPTSEKA
jgi:hypothetical protein